MAKRTVISSVLAIVLGALLVGPNVLRAEDPTANPKPPYPAGPPPVTDGYTDTSHDGTKTSGNAPIPPPSKDGKVVTIEGHAEHEPTAAPAK